MKKLLVITMLLFYVNAGAQVPLFHAHNVSAANNDSALLVQELFLWHKMDEGSGTTILDASGVALASGVLGTYSWSSACIVGPYALDLTSGAGFADLQYAPWNVADQDSMTVSAWVYPTNTDNTTFRPVVSCLGFNGVSYTSQMSLFIYDGAIYFYVLDNVGNSVQSGSAIPINTWTHVAAVKEGTTLKLYLNGALVDTDTNGSLGTVNIFGNGGTNARLGRGAPGVWYAASYFSGKIDDFRWYMKAANPAKITAIYNYR